MKLEQTWRWYGPDDAISLTQIKQTGATGIVSALHHIPIGEVWSTEEITQHKNRIEEAGLTWSVVESIPVHEDIKRRTGAYKLYTERWRQSVLNLGECGIQTVCYNFMPVLDWTRTDLEHPMPDGSTGLRFDETALAAFDLFILKRAGADSSYDDEVKGKAEQYFKTLGQAEQTKLINTILAGLPGSEAGYTLGEFREILETYKDISAEDLRQNLYEFVAEIIPAAEKASVRMAIHPDDPPFTLFGLPRVISTEEDAKMLTDAVSSVYNGLTFCTGSYGARPDNDLPGMIERLGDRINFIHLRNVQLEDGSTFHEADHLDGSVEMNKVMKALILEQKRRRENGRTDLDIPMRPDHGHKMLDDLPKENSAPGYSLIGRMRGLAELRGLEMGLRKLLE